jgi:hypothetical protein
VVARMSESGDCGNDVSGEEYGAGCPYKPTKGAQPACGEVSCCENNGDGVKAGSPE